MWKHSYFPNLSVYLLICFHLSHRAPLWSADHMATYPIVFTVIVPPSWSIAGFVPIVERIPMAQKRLQCWKQNSYPLYLDQTLWCHFHLCLLQPLSYQYQTCLVFLRYWELRRPASPRVAKMRAQAGYYDKLWSWLRPLIFSYSKHGNTTCSSSEVK